MLLGPARLRWSCETRRTLWTILVLFPFSGPWIKVHEVSLKRLPEMPLQYTHANSFAKHTPPHMLCLTYHTTPHTILPHRLTHHFTYTFTHTATSHTQAHTYHLTHHHLIESISYQERFQTSFQNFKSTMPLGSADWKKVTYMETAVNLVA